MVVHVVAFFPFFKDRFSGADYPHTVYVPIEARYPIEARPPFREQKLHANVYICNKMESLSNQNDI